MSTYINILYGKFLANEAGNPAVVNNRNKFTVNTGVNTVNFDTSTGPTWNFTFCKDGALGGNPFRFFRGRDQIRVLSFGIILPHGLQLGDTPLLFGIGKSMYTGAAFSQNVLFTEFSDASANSVIEVPFTNYEIALDVVSPYQNQNIGTPNFQMWYSIFGWVASGNISMVGVNSSLNGQVLTPVPFIKVMHSLHLENSTF